MSSSHKTAVVTGASSGIGAATAAQLAAAGWAVVIGARRADRLAQVAERIGPAATPLPLDVTSTESVEAFSAQVPQCHLLVNNAGGALGRSTVSEADEEQWRWMYEANVMGTMRMTRALLPKLEASGDGHIVNVGSIAGLQPYEGGAGYTSVKHGLRAVTQTLRLELLGKPVRITEIDPGMVETEFSLVRFGGDAAKAGKVYEGVEPLTADDVAEAIVWAATRPSHVNIDSMLIMPRDQAGARDVYRRT